MALRLAHAQSAFEVASVKQTLQSALGFTKLSQPGELRFTASNVTLELLTELAFGVEDRQIQSAPGWMVTDHYDVVAKADRNITPAERTQMVQTLLEARFQLASHQETKETAGFALVPANPPPSLIRSQGKLVVFQSQSIFALASYLSQILQVPVVDYSRIRGTYDFTLDTDRSPGEPFPDRLRSAVEDFGFRFESQKLPVQSTVIDHAERPTEN